eukprot:m.219555 g.219555  ORF g.219555 m.219555 type:complete len:101 (+) comp13825_c11_seq2:269-571(+)
METNDDNNNSSSDNQWGEEGEARVWYASYGSNMCMDRLMCYIKGGSLPSMSSSCVNCKDTQTLWMQRSNASKGKPSVVHTAQAVVCTIVWNMAWWGSLFH